MQLDEHPTEPATDEPGQGPAADGPVPRVGAAPVGHVRERAERVVAPVLVLVAAVRIVGPNLADGPAKASLDTLWRPAVVLGLEQDWRVFSPNPVDQSVEVFAVVDLADGTQVEWHAPERDVVFGAYTEYRWQKWQERVRLDQRSDLWAPTAEWIADRVRSDGLDPVRVRLVRRWIVHLPLSSEGIDDGDWQSSVFFDLPLTPDAGGAPG